MQLILKPYHYAVFSVNLMAPNWEGTFAAEVIIVTQFEVSYTQLLLHIIIVPIVDMRVAYIRKHTFLGNREHMIIADYNIVFCSYL